LDLQKIAIFDKLLHTTTMTTWEIVLEIDCRKRKDCVEDQRHLYCNSSTITVLGEITAERIAAEKKDS
jgi:hypothetical protein